MAAVAVRVIAIDGPSGSGKTTLARALSSALGLAHLDTGAMYRAVAFAALKDGIDPSDADAVAAMSRRLSVEVGEKVIVDGGDATAGIRTPEVTAAASVVAANPAVRTELVARQRTWVESRNGGIVEGRDIGSVVFPDAELKLYLVARADERARRRAEESGAAEDATAEEMAERDARDRSRSDSPLLKTSDAHEIDTTGRDVDGVVAEVLALLKRPAHTMRTLDHHTAYLYRPPTRASRIFFAVCRAITAAVCRVFCRVTVEGRENLPRSGPYVLAPVHRSYVDWIVLGCISRDRIRFMAKDTLWGSRFIGWLLESLGTFPVHRGSADRTAFSTCVKILEAGEPCVIFPEGQRRSGPTVEDLFDGASYVAAKAGVPLVPVGIGGSERVMQKGKILPRPYKVHIVVGEPVAIERSPGRVPRRVVTETTANLRNSLQALFDRAQRRVGLLQPGSLGEPGAST